jgi:glycosyltransferase involved in cell wall biosynthesis
LNKLKVVWLSPPMYPINHEFFNLLAENIDLIVYQFGDHPKFKINSELFKNKTYQLKLINKYTFHNRKQNGLLVIKELFKDKPDIVVSVAFWVPTLYAILFKKIIGYKILISTDATTITETKIPFYKLLIRKFLCYFSDGLIAASNFTKQYLETLSKNKNIFLSTQTVNTSKWMKEINNLPSSDIIRKDLNLSNDEIILLGVGNYEKRKNWQAIFDVVNNINNCRLILIGAGELKEEYEKHIIEHNLNNKILLIDWKNPDELKKFYKSADIFIFPTLKDQFGFVVVEALSSSLPVICSNKAGASELIRDNYNGFVINPQNNFKQLEKYIEKIITNKEYFKHNAQLTAKNFTLEKRVIEHIKIFNKIRKEK